MHFNRLVLAIGLGTLGWAQNQPAMPQSPAVQQPSSTITSHQSASSAAAERERSGADPLLDLPRLPDAKMTVIGGTVTKLDRVRDRLVLRPFGSKDDMRIAFDLRTKITQSGVVASLKDIHPGSRVYADTMLNGDQIFARNIRIEGGQVQGDARGQVVAYDAARGLLSLREQVSPEPVKLRITPTTQVQISKKPASIAEVRPGALVVVDFVPGGEGMEQAQQVRVLANPGEAFKFVGRITFVDMRSKRFAIANQSDNETYDLVLGPVPSQVARSLREGQNAIVSAVFNGQAYEAHEIEVSPSAAAPKE
jgi:hypothetical protein